MYINNIFVAQFIFKKMLFACKIKRFQLSYKLYIYIKGKCMCKLLYCIIFVAFLKYRSVMECHVLVICMSIHLYACNEIIVLLIALNIVLDKGQHGMIIFVVVHCM